MLPYQKVLPYVFSNVFKPLTNCLYQTILPLQNHATLHRYSLCVHYKTLTKINQRWLNRVEWGLDLPAHE